MYFSLSKEQELELLNKPETGMGYQVIEAAKSGSYHREKYIVLNCELVIEMDQNQSKIIHLAMSKGLLQLKHEAEKITLSLHFAKYYNEREYRTAVHERKLPWGLGAIDNPKDYADGEETFVRLSAFEDDKRVDKDKKCLIPGSYATTLDDYLFCKKSNDDPIERYALPSEEMITWAFHILPLKTDILQRGLVQPANDKKGGGKEVYFEQGTSKDTLTKISAY